MSTDMAEKGKAQATSDPVPVQLLEVQYILRGNQVFKVLVPSKVTPPKDAGILPNKPEQEPNPIICKVQEVQQFKKEMKEMNEALGKNPSCTMSTFSSLTEKFTNITSLVKLPISPVHPSATVKPTETSTDQVSVTSQNVSLPVQNTGIGTSIRQNSGISIPVQNTGIGMPVRQNTGIVAPSRQNASIGIPVQNTGIGMPVRQNTGIVTPNRQNTSIGIPVQNAGNGTPVQNSRISAVMPPLKSYLSKSEMQKESASKKISGQQLSKQNIVTYNPDEVVVKHAVVPSSTAASHPSMIVPPSAGVYRVNVDSSGKMVVSQENLKSGNRQLPRNNLRTIPNILKSSANYLGPLRTSMVPVMPQKVPAVPTPVDAQRLVPQVQMAQPVQNLVKTHTNISVPQQQVQSYMSQKNTLASSSVIPPTSMVQPNVVSTKVIRYSGPGGMSDLQNMTPLSFINSSGKEVPVLMGPIKPVMNPGQSLLFTPFKQQEVQKANGTILVGPCIAQGNSILTTSTSSSIKAAPISQGQQKSVTNLPTSMATTQHLQIAPLMPPSLKRAPIQLSQSSSVSSLVAKTTTVTKHSPEVIWVQSPTKAPLKNGSCGQINSALSSVPGNVIKPTQTGVPSGNSTQVFARIQASSSQHSVKSDQPTLPTLQVVNKSLQPSTRIVPVPTSQSSHPTYLIVPPTSEAKGPAKAVPLGATHAGISPMPVQTSVNTSSKMPTPVVMNAPVSTSGPAIAINTGRLIAAPVPAQQRNNQIFIISKDIARKSEPMFISSNSTNWKQTSTFTPIFPLGQKLQSKDNIKQTVGPITNAPSHKPGIVFLKNITNVSSASKGTENVQNKSIQVAISSSSRVAPTKTVSSTISGPSVKVLSAPDKRNDVPKYLQSGKTTEANAQDVDMNFLEPEVIIKENTVMSDVSSKIQENNDTLNKNQPKLEKGSVTVAKSIELGKEKQPEKASPNLHGMSLNNHDKVSNLPAEKNLNYHCVKRKLNEMFEKISNKKQKQEETKPSPSHNNNSTDSILNVTIKTEPVDVDEPAEDLLTTESQSVDNILSSESAINFNDDENSNGQDTAKITEDNSSLNTTVVSTDICPSQSLPQTSNYENANEIGVEDEVNSSSDVEPKHETDHHLNFSLPDDIASEVPIRKRKRRRRKLLGMSKYYVKKFQGQRKKMCESQKEASDLIVNKREENFMQPEFQDLSVLLGQCSVVLHRISDHVLKEGTVKLTKKDLENMSKRGCGSGTCLNDNSSTCGENAPAEILENVTLPNDSAKDNVTACESPSGYPYPVDKLDSVLELLKQKKEALDSLRKKYAK